MPAYVVRSNANLRATEERMISLRDKKREIISNIMLSQNIYNAIGSWAANNRNILVMHKKKLAVPNACIFLIR